MEILTASISKFVNLPVWAMYSKTKISSEKTTLRSVKDCWLFKGPPSRYISQSRRRSSYLTSVETMKRSWWPFCQSLSSSASLLNPSSSTQNALKKRSSEFKTNWTTSTPIDHLAAMKNRSTLTSASVALSFAKILGIEQRWWMSTAIQRSSSPSWILDSLCSSTLARSVASLIYCATFQGWFSDVLCQDYILHAEWDAGMNRPLIC